MTRRLHPFLIVVLLVLLSLVLTGCEKERPAPASGAATPPARGTVALTLTAPAALTQAPLPGESGAGATPVPVGAATPTAPAPQPVVVSPAGTRETSAAGQFFTYTVVAGDTLAAIAARFGTTSDAIVQLNGLGDPNALTLGQALKIPGTAPASSSESTAATSGSTAATSGVTSATSTYVVQSGDTLGRIAQRFGTTVSELVRLNNLTNPDRIGVGQKLIVPATSGAAPASGSSTTTGARRTYAVQRGDTLLSIARRFGVTVKQLQAANNIANPDRIYPGQVLVIP